MARSAAIRFDVHPAVLMMEKWVRSLPEQTGRTLDEWVALVRKSGPKEEKAARDWLKEKHGFGTNAAWSVAEHAFTKEKGLFDDDTESYLRLAPKYVAEQYAGKKEGLRPIFDRLYSLGRGLGKDVRVCPCKTIVPLFRHHVFAQIKPTTNTRVDLGLCLTPMCKAGKKPPERILDTGGFAKKDRITHRIPLATVDEIDAFVERWLAKAYELDAAGD